MASPSRYGKREENDKPPGEDNNDEQHSLLHPQQQQQQNGLRGWMSRIQNSVIPSSENNEDEETGGARASNAPSSALDNEMIKELKHEMRAPIAGNPEDRRLTSNNSIHDKPVWMFVSIFILLFTVFYGFHGLIYALMITGMFLAYRICNRRHPAPARSEQDGAAASSMNGSGGRTSSSRRGGGSSNVRGIKDLPQSKPSGG